MGSGITKFEIEKTSTATIFHPGQVIRGNVTVINSNPCEHRGIKVRCEGYVPGNSNNVRGARGAKNKNRKHHLHLETCASEGECLPPGRHVFPFTFTLPRSLPSSSYVVTYTLSGNMYGVKKNFEAEVLFKVRGNCKWTAPPSSIPSPA